VEAPTGDFQDVPLCRLVVQRQNHVAQAFATFAGRTDAYFIDAARAPDQVAEAVARHVLSGGSAATGPRPATGARTDR
jgi:hypothetical protein